MFWPASAFLPFAELFGDGFGPEIVEPHAIHNRLSGGSPEHPRFWVSRLRVPGHPAQFAEAKAKFLPDRHGGGVLVHAGGQPDGIGKLQTQNFNRQCRRAIETANEAAEFLAATRQGQLKQRQIVSPFRILCKENRPKKFAICPSHTGLMEDGLAVERRAGRTIAPGHRPV